MSAKLEISYGQSSAKGIKQQNEDSYGVTIPDNQLLASKGIVAIIADGMGSCAYPKEASEYVVKGFLAIITAHLKAGALNLQVPECSPH